MEDIVRILRQGAYSCVVANQGRVETFSRRGVADLYCLLRENPEFLRGARIADKVVGKAAAALMILAGASRLYAEVLSRPALELLQRAGLETHYSQCVPYIINRSASGWCPLETRCFTLQTPEECLVQITDFLAGIAGADTVSSEKSSTEP